MIKLLIANLILKLLDMITTFYAVSQHGSSVEGNPIVKCSIEHLGNFSYFLNYSIFAALVIVGYKLGYRVLLIIAVVMMALVVLNNLIMIGLSL